MFFTEVETPYKRQRQDKRRKTEEEIISSVSVAFIPTAVYHPPLLSTYRSFKFEF